MSTQRDVIFAINEIYHIYNRSVAREHIFSSRINLRKALEIANFYRFPQEIRLSKFNNLTQELKDQYLKRLKTKIPLVEIYAYAFMPNHYHFLLKQVQEKGISQFISNFQNSFAKYFNTKNDRHGSLFQNPFKGKRVETSEQLIHISRYIHLNPVTSYIIEYEKLHTYPWTSFPVYVIADNNEYLPINTELLLNMFPSHKNYIDFIENQVEYQQSITLIQNIIID